MRVLIVITWAIFLTACSEKNVAQKEIYPVLPSSYQTENSQKLLKVVTYSGERVHHTIPVVHSYGGVTQEQRPVFINSHSQFVLRDQTPVLFRGEGVYWGEGSKVINRRYEVLDKSRIFSINGEPSGSNTAFTIMEFFSAAGYKY